MTYGNPSQSPASLPPLLEIEPSGPVAGSVRPPGSKSITNRALVCASLAQGESLLDSALDSDDTQVMVASLQRLGFSIEHDKEARSIRVSGQGGRVPSPHADLFVGNSGTTVRFLTAMLTLGQGDYRLDGTPRMRERPIGDLLDALAQLGADARAESAGGCPPVVVRGRGLRGGRATIAGSISSQFLSGLLLAAPAAQGDVELAVRGELVSQPYVAMTLAVIDAFGCRVLRPEEGLFHIPAPQVYQAAHYRIEPDASAASYFFAAAAVAGGAVTVEGLAQHSLQGDVAFCECLAQMGAAVEYGPQGITVRGPVRRGIDVDMNAISDTVQTLGVVALFVEGPTTIRGVGHIRHKETDRIAALAAELRKMGAAVEERPDGLRIVPQTRRGAEIATYDDHRMAMSFAIAGLAQPGVRIMDPGCTAKTYPRFFEDLSRIVTLQR